MSDLAVNSKGVLEASKVQPVYVWKTGTTMFLSKKQQLMLDAYVETLSLDECARVLEANGFDADKQDCKRWLEGELVKTHLEDRLREKSIANGWTRERWLLVMTEHLEGKKRLQSGDLYGMNVLAKVMGWDLPKGGGVVTNIQILQSNGKE